jgi:cobalt-zinc-cadmium efflux system membrane fusion protein
MTKSIFVGIIITLFAFTSCNKKVAEQEAETKFVLSDTMFAHTGFSDAHTQRVKNELKLFGKIAPDNNKMVEVLPIVGGNVSQVTVELGDYVQQGQTLAIIRSGEVAEFERQRMDALSDVSTAEKNLQVAQDLFRSKLNSEKDVLAAQNELDKTKAELRRITEVFSIYGLSDKSQYNVKAPIAGFVVQKNINRDMQLRNDRNEAIFTIAQIDEVWILANVNESDISKIKLGYEADIKTLSYPDKTFKGKVDRIFNILDPQTKTMKARVKIPNPDYLLKPEMNASITLKYEEEKNLIAIPASAVIFDKSKNYVMVYKGRDNIETRLIEVYRQTGDTTYISSGLEEGEKIISKNQMLIYDALND